MTNVGWKKRRALGQHLLISHLVCEKIVDSADLRESDTVIEIGTGEGFLTKHIAKRDVLKIRTFEIDQVMFTIAKRNLENFRNIELVNGDAFKFAADENNFQVCMSSLPYSRSLDFVRWLSLRSGRFRTAVVLVQSDFARKLQAGPHDPKYRAISVMSQISFDVEELDRVDRSCFSPPPRVQSVILKFTAKQDARRPFFNENKISILNQLFSFRGRLLQNALKATYKSEQVKQLYFEKEFTQKRIENLTPPEYKMILDRLWTNKKDRVLS